MCGSSNENISPSTRFWETIWNFLKRFSERFGKVQVNEQYSNTSDASIKIEHTLGAVHDISLCGSTREHNECWEQLDWSETEKVTQTGREARGESTYFRWVHLPQHRPRDDKEAHGSRDLECPIKAKPCTKDLYHIPLSRKTQLFLEKS